MLLLALISTAAAQDCVRVRVGEVLPLQTLAAASCVELQDRAASTVDWIRGDSICHYTGRFALTGAGCYPDPRQLGAGESRGQSPAGQIVELADQVVRGGAVLAHGAFLIVALTVGHARGLTHAQVILYDALAVQFAHSLRFSRPVK